MSDALSMGQAGLDVRNREFWEELCGSAFARRLGITSVTPETVARFDRAFLDYYPYLAGYVTREEVAGKRVLEVGLGYGTLGQLLYACGADYHGLDIAAGPVEMMRARLQWLGAPDADQRVLHGSALEIPHAPASFDLVFSIGCLHHTGDLERGVREAHRVLRPGGVAVVMLYNRFSMRRFVLAPLVRLTGRIGAGEEGLRALYDQSLAGEPAPYTDYVTPLEAREFFRSFADVRIRKENLDSLPIIPGRLRIPREPFLGNLARIAGVDLYIRARK